MLEIRITSDGFESNQKISPSLFGELNNALVSVICEQPCYTEPNELQDSICDFMTQSLDEGYVVSTHHATPSLSYGENELGKYVNEMQFQVFI